MSGALMRGAGVAAVALLTTLATTLPAHAINRTDCGNRDDFLAVYTYDSHILCFANAGEVNVAIYQPMYIKTGNNVVRVRYRPGMNAPAIEAGVGKWSSYSFQQEWKLPLQPPHKLEWIKIH
ncbi:hypothetical protein OG311_00100 [Streptomyces sp. NBC_01343]|uniref:beta/gamma crystallin domain-containing protein n=2 Tax=Streptomyces TaxID=1883 RepID=UPI0004C928F9|nr:beta/gamma crystallin domain-containing protein [Streptomyces sp. NBC_01343]WSI21989.1 hypothetical protein OG311_00100 [Streptomyces sp. NBC_01343]